MKGSKDAMPPDKFRKLVERLSYLDFKGCKTEKEINDVLARAF